LSEPAARSAATDMTTALEETPTGFRLDGHKCWITGAGTSRLYLVYARFGARPGAEGIGGVFVERDTPGFRIGRRELMMGLRGIPEGELHFENCQIPRENLLVGPGDGFKKLMSAYNGQRLGAATVALGIAQGAYERALGYAAERKQFGRAIGEFQGIRWKLADMAIKLDAARLLIHRAAVRAGRSEEHTSELQSPYDLVCRLLLEKKKKEHVINIHMDIPVDDCITNCHHVK